MADPVERVQQDVTVLSGTVTDLGVTLAQVSNRAVTVQMRFVAGGGPLALNQTRDITVVWQQPMTVNGYFVVATPTDPAAYDGVAITTVSTSTTQAVIRVKALRAITLTGTIFCLAQTLKQSSA